MIQDEKCGNNGADTGNPVDQPGHSDTPQPPEKAKVPESYRDKALGLWKSIVWNRVLLTVGWTDHHAGVIAALATVAIAYLTFSLAEDSRRQAETANGQLKIMQGQLAEIRSEQRPWIKVEATPGRIDSLTAVTNPNAPEKIFYPHFKATNVGHSPAFNVRISILGYLTGVNGRDSTIAQKSLCAKAKAEPLDNEARGVNLFPGDSITEHGGFGTIVVGFSSDDIKKYVINKDGEIFYMFDVIGCVTYLVGDTKEIHQTGFVYQIFQVEPAGNGTQITYLFNASESIPENRIRMYQSPSSSLAD